MSQKISFSKQADCSLTSGFSGPNKSSQEFPEKQAQANLNTELEIWGREVTWFIKLL